MRYDYLIAGGGIIGLSIARELIRREPHARIAIIEKEADVAKHASGRNSGVLHAGFYYTADSLKARFTRDGNRAMKKYCEENGLSINPCGKLVVASDESELQGLEELKRRAVRNGVRLEWASEAETAGMDPNVKTHKKALYSPDTASVDPVEVCQCLKREIVSSGVDLFFNTKYVGRSNQTIRTNKSAITCGYFINAAGLFADQIAHDFGFGLQYTIIPFKGIYMKYAKNKSDVATNIYPVPNLNNPFLGVHFTKTVDGSIKIGPTAIPAFWRENYKGFHRFNFKEFIQIIYYEAKLFMTNSFRFRQLAFEEMKKYNRANFIGLSLKMVKDLDSNGFGDFLRPGIRAQLLNKKTLELVQDFVVEGDAGSIHVLNAVSPAFTCAFPFAEYVVELIGEKRSAEQSSLNSKPKGDNVCQAT